MYLIGHSTDIHKLSKQERNINQKIGGINIETTYKIVAHSDGDIVYHAIAESILGALSLDDIGTYFSDTDKSNKNMESKIILDHSLKLMNDNGYQINNIDLLIICEHIIFKNYKQLIKDNLISILNTNKISVKATRYEEDKNMIQCNVTVLLIKKDLIK